MAAQDPPCYGNQELASGNGKFNSLSFLIKAQLAALNIATLVEVISCTASGTEPVGTVSVTPLVNQVDGGGNAIPHGVIYEVPYFRYQGGQNAVIVDPVQGDLGYCVFADRDISGVKATGAAASPGSKRRFNMADGLYLGGWNMGVAPTSYLQVTQGSISLVLPGGTNLVLTPGLCTVNANLKVNGTSEVTGNAQFDASATVAENLTFGGGLAGTGAAGGGGATISGPVTATGDVKGNGISLDGHKHSGVTTGSGTTGGPQ